MHCVVHAAAMTEESKIATHSDPVGRDRTNFIVQLDLTDRGMPGTSNAEPAPAPREIVAPDALRDARIS
jgi:hypothetical protein